MTACVILLLTAAGPVPAPAYTGKVVAHEGGVALVTDGGKVYPLAKTEASRLFFDDPDTRARPVRLYAHPRGGRLEVRRVRTLIDGKPNDVFYWCERCQLRYAGPGKCLCCGDVTELREEPEK